MRCKLLMLTIRDSVRLERPTIHRSKAEDEARSTVTKTSMVTVAAAGKIGRQSAANAALLKGILRRNDEQARVLCELVVHCRLQPCICLLSNPGLFIVASQEAFEKCSIRSRLTADFDATVTIAVFVTAERASSSAFERCIAGLSTLTDSRMVSIRSLHLIECSALIKCVRGWQGQARSSKVPTDLAAQAPWKALPARLTGPGKVPAGLAREAYQYLQTTLRVA